MEKTSLIGVKPLSPIVSQRIIEEEKKRKNKSKEPSNYQRMKEILRILNNEKAHLVNNISYICRWCNNHLDDHSEDCPVGLAQDLLYDIEHK